MENYQQFYYALFNSLTDLITELEKRECSQEAIVEELKKIQRNAEERFIDNPPA